MNDEPIYPQVEIRSKEVDIRWKGLTKREWFAGMALSGIMANAYLRDTVGERARVAFILADEMIKESKK